MLTFMKVTRPSPYGTKLTGVRQGPAGGSRPPPPIVPHPEPLAAQVAYPFGHSSTTQVSLGPKCFQTLGSSPGLLVTVRHAT